MATTPAPISEQRRPQDYASSQEVRWCPGCGDYSVLAQIKQTLSRINADPDKTVFVSGIGCSSRLPYYLNNYGIHGFHGRAPAIASGLKLSRPDLDVWVVTGDGDGMAIGGNHLMHAIRRNMNLTILLLNNRIYGLTKGQVSPTSEQGKVTVSTPFGSIGAQISPCAFAVGAEATFVARTVDTNPSHLEYTLQRAMAHEGVSFVEIYQNCVVFNNSTFEYASNRAIRDDNLVELGHGKAMIFGKNQEKGIRLASGYRPEVVAVGENGVAISELLIHDERTPSPALAFLLSRLRHPEFPEPIGVFRDVKAPSYDTLLNKQIETLTQEMGRPDLQELLNGKDSWTVE